MTFSFKKIYLASKSPRRQKLLSQIGIKFTYLDIGHFEEIIIPNENPTKTIRRITLGKLEQAKKLVKDGIIITADTIVVIDDKILGKPKNDYDAKQILNNLSNRKHFVYTGFAFYDTLNNQLIYDYSRTTVYFRELDQLEIEAYIKSGSPMDKAGAYGIQDDYGAVFVKKISGCYYNVVGLPLSKFYSKLNKILNNG